MSKQFTKTGERSDTGKILWRTRSGALLTRSEISRFYAERAKINARIDEFNKALENEKYIYESGEVTSYSELRKSGVPIDFIVKKKDIGVGAFKSRSELDTFIANADTGSTIDTILRKKNDQYQRNFFEALKRSGYDEGDVDDIRSRVSDLSPEERDRLFRQYEIFNVKKPYENRGEDSSYIEDLNDVLDEFIGETEDEDEEDLPF